MSKKLFHRRNDSGELDVFEAENYFAGANDDDQVSCHSKNGLTFSYHHKFINSQAMMRGGRMSLDMPMEFRHSSTPFGRSSQMEKPASMKDKCKQPSSPGGKLASFLNSLFNQTISSKKKKKKSNSAAKAEDAKSPSNGWMRRRRSSISELYGRSLSNTIYDTAPSGSGFRTPPPYPFNPKKSCRNNQKLENVFKFSNGIPEGNSVHQWAHGYPIEKNALRKFGDDNDNDDDGKSDSSSDLFDLPNSELSDYCSSGLRVYETTKIGTINSCVPISATVI